MFQIMVLPTRDNHFVKIVEKFITFGRNGNTFSDFSLITEDDILDIEPYFFLVLWGKSIVFIILIPNEFFIPECFNQSWY